MKPEAGLKTPLHRDLWTTTRLKFLLERKRRDLHPDDGVVTAFRDGEVTLRSKRREDGFTFADKEIGYQGVEPGDLVIHAMDGFAGAIGVSDSRGKCSPVYTITVPRLNAQAHTSFWAYYLRNLAVTGFIESLAKGIRERSTDFRWNDAGNLLVNFPDFNTQKAIAGFLDRETARIDRLINKKQRLVDLLRERRTATISEAVGKASASSPRLRPWITINPSSREHGLKADTDVTFAPMEALRDGTGGLDVSQIRPLAEVASASYNYFAEGDLLLAKVTPCFENGKKAIAEGLINGVGFATSEVFVIRPDLSKLNTNYLRYLFSSEQFRAAGIASMTGAGGLRRISEAAIRDFKLPVQSLVEQEAIAECLDGELQRQTLVSEKTGESIDRLREFRSALISAAVTGQIDVTSWSKEGTTDRRLDQIEVDMACREARA